MSTWAPEKATSN